MGYIDEAMAAASRAALRDMARRLGLPPLEPWQETVLDHVYTMRRDSGPIRVVAHVGKPVPEIEARPTDCRCPTNSAGDIQCHNCGERVNVRCWNCRTPRGAGPCPTIENGGSDIDG